MKRIWLVIRSVVLWAVSIFHFFTIASLLVLLGIFIDPRKNDRPQRWLFRNVLRMAGVGFQTKYAPGFDRTRTSLFVCNHVNFFDAFVIYSAIPQFVRGLERETHFKVPAYGWMMKRFGNVPVPKENDPRAYRMMLKRVKQALDDGISLIVFAEGGRTLDGRVRPLKDGVFRMAIQFGYPIVPMSIVGSFEFNRKGSWMLRPSTITVHLHDTIETAGLTKDKLDTLRERVYRIVSRPVDAALGTPAENTPPRTTQCG